ncbi:MAG: 16S rRNA (uracil(1498)-N(3))-methyltransferase [Gammaproteobacteria bacterium]|nr:16S rRNA (uracil(1498)-N(3))-methyltransferase [Gammaproteobacteria bacterium]
MRIPRIFLDATFISTQSIELTEHAFQHAIKVLRLKQNAKLILFNGEGEEYSAMVESINKKSASVKILEQLEPVKESNLFIHLGLGISKGERMDFAIQKAVEMGVTEITPLFTEYCVVSLDEKRRQKKVSHWQGIIISACEQCGRSILPVLNPPVTLSIWAQATDDYSLIFDPLATRTLKDITPDNNKLNLIIGPEGGLSSNEISDLNKKANFHAVKFGPRVLRTETAAVSAITAAQLLWGDLLK